MAFDDNPHPGARPSLILSGSRSQALFVTLRCNHCFLSLLLAENHHARNDDVEQFLPHTGQTRSAWCQGIYFTGANIANAGSPLKFLKPHCRVPGHVLDKTPRFSAGKFVTQLISMRDASLYSLELRRQHGWVFTGNKRSPPWTGTFKRIMLGIKLLLDGGFVPIITAMGGA